MPTTRYKTSADQDTSARDDETPSGAGRAGGVGAEDLPTVVPPAVKPAADRGTPNPWERAKVAACGAPCPVSESDGRPLEESARVRASPSSVARQIGGQLSSHSSLLSSASCGAT
eukprot:6615836-Prymnesium_polylepis.1